MRCDWNLEMLQTLSKWQLLMFFLGSLEVLFKYLLFVFYIAVVIFFLGP